MNTFLDVGCGTGEYLIEALKFSNKTIGLDISSTYLKRVKKICKELSLVQADAQALPFKDKAVDYILCSETIEHLESSEIALSEISRVARKGFIISTPNYGFLRAALNKISQSLLSELDRSVGHVNVLPLFRLHEKILKNNCRIKEEKTVHITPPIMGKIFHLPTMLSPILDKCELLLNKILPKLGNISIVEVEVLPIEDYLSK